MHGTKRVVAWAAVAAFAVVGSSASAHAQMSINNEWRYSVTPYAWAAGIDGDVGVGRLSSDVSLSPGDILKKLDFGIMAQGEAHKGPWMGSLDAIYVKVGDAKAFAVRGDTGALDLSQHQTIISPVAGYTIGNLKWSVDFTGGIRYWDISTSLDVTRPRLTNERSSTQRWVDAIGGARFGWLPHEKVRFSLGGDGGGGGSRGTWQAYSTLTYDTRTKGFGLVLNYRTW